MAMGLAGGSGPRRGRLGRGARAPMAEINVTPFVDVMLVLLIIFMVTAPLLTAGVPIDLPDSRAKALAEERDKITLSISPDGALYLDDRELSLAELSGELTCEAGDKPPIVTLRADKALDYGTVMAVMGELNRAGCNSISLVTNASGSLPASADAGAASDDATSADGAGVIDGSGEAP